MSYLDLLKLASPEAIVVLTALVVLSIGLLTERAAAVCALIGALGLAIATGAVLMLPHYASLFGGMLVITPLTSLFKVICLGLAFFTVCLVRSEKSLLHMGDYLAVILFLFIDTMPTVIYTLSLLDAIPIHWPVRSG